jgi:hypothetical protein
MDLVDDWLADRIGRVRPGLLVLARTRALVVRTRRWLGDRQLGLGVDVLTPAGLARQLAVRPFTPPPEEPAPAHPLLVQLAGRPGLTRSLQDHLRWMRRNPDVTPPAAWAGLVASAWADDAETRAIRRLATRARDRSLPAPGWRRVVALGFDLPDDVLEPWIRDLLRDLGADRAAPVPEADRIASRAVPDPSAEAREAIAQVRVHGPVGALALVADADSAVRLAEAATRNGVPCAWVIPDRPGQHALAEAIRWLARWADQPSDRTGRDTLLRHALRGSFDGAPASGPSLSRAARRAALEGCDASETDLAGWHRRLDARATSADAEAVAWWRQLLPPAAGNPWPTTAALAQHLRASGCDDDPPAPRALLAALTADGGSPWSELPDRLRDATTARGFGTGLEILTYDDYDGRPARLLLLLDCHDRGLARRPPPDPLLHPADAARFGQLTGGAAVSWRVAQARRAAAHAHTPLALVAARDSGGRAVSPPTSLPLVPAPGAPQPAYGLGRTDLPEFAAWSALTLVQRPLPPPWAEDLAGRLARRATLDWVRAGRVARTLDDPHARASLGPWLGDAGPAGALPDGPRSVTGFLKPLAICPWRAFTGAILGIRPRGDEAAAPGSHQRPLWDALRDADAAGAFSWDRDAADRAQARVEATRAAFARTLAARELPMGERLACEGERDRWVRHWTATVERPAPARRGVDTRWLDRLLALHPASAAVSTLALPPHARTPFASLIRRAAGGDWPGSPEDLAERLAVDDVAVADAWAAVTAAQAGRGPLLPWLAAAARLVGRADAAGRGPPPTESALAPPNTPTDQGPIAITLGDQRLVIQGGVDQAGEEHGLWTLRLWRPLARQIDRRDAERDLLTGRDPTLAVAALASEASGRPVHAVGWTALRADAQAPVDRRALALPVEPGALTGALAPLGDRLADARRGRWPVLPRADSCPWVAFDPPPCPVRSACRLGRGGAVDGGP